MSNGSPLPGTLSTSPQADPSLHTSGQADTTSPIPRSASSTQLPTDAKVDTIPQRKPTLSRSLSENVLANIQGNILRQGSTKKGSEDAYKLRTRSLRRLGSSKRHKESDPQFAISKFTIGPDPSPQELIDESEICKDGTTTGYGRRAPSVAGSISSLALKSWISKSRSPSPSPTKTRLRKETGPGFESTRQVNGSNSAVDVTTTALPTTEVRDDASNPSSNSHAKGSLRHNSVLTRSRRPLSSLLSKAPPSGTSSVPPVPKSYSTDRLSLSRIQSTSSKPPVVPKSWSSERLQGLGAETPRRKDELWSVFRTLDGEYQKFQSRPSTMKTGIVRSVLLPFLRSHAEHPSISSLRPEDLDRRTFILNKWWTGLLEMLNGRHGESVSGNDRPAILEAVTALMARPEWTLPLSSIMTRPIKTARTSLKSQSTTSLGSNMSDFLADSVHHNVRNTFTQKLLAQMAYVVDKMSTRNVAASVVTFCGRATAYAFFYCEGIAEILVRLWATPSETLRRVLAQGSTQKQPEIDSVSDRVCTAYPQCLHSLKLKALRPMMKYLRSKPQSPLPIATTYIPWHGPWVSRWAGKDTDLFFVFTKFYTDLACRFLPDDPSPEEIMAAPAWALVQAQILTVLDATIQQTNSQPPIGQIGPSSITFDALLQEADASATMLPLPAHGVVRTMGENRLIMLLRECLSSSTIMAGKSRSIFAQSFSGLLKVAARRTSMYDHNACFTLCDFLEEAIPILQRYQQDTDAAVSLIDWSFWLDVCRHMYQSQNSMTEVRLCAFLYSMWSTITSDEARRREVCLHWLLAEDTFHANFNHWCPMVRAFYMRLVVWKIARLNDNGSDVNIAILEALDLRLQQVYRIFLYNQENAQRKHLAPPSTAPCSPAPGRCLEIVRNDTQMAPGGSFLTFDAILSSASTKNANPYEEHNAQELASTSSLSQLRKDAEDTSKSQDGGRKRWNLFKSIIPSTSPKDSPKTTSAKDTLAALQSSTTSRRGSAEGSAPKTAINGVAGPAPSYRTLSFKISLEWIDQDSNNPAGRDRRLYPPKLPLPAQLFLQSRQSEDTRDNSPLEPVGVMAGPSRYAGRALAEWAILITECQNFFERRKAEGVPSYLLVETPTLGVDPFRKV